MLNKSLVALAAVLCGFSAAPALAANALSCEQPVIQVSSVADNSVAQYAIRCVGAHGLAVVPTVTFAGEVFAHGSPPYPVKASYNIDIRDPFVKSVTQEPRVDQVANGVLLSSTVSIAALPAQFASQTEWDALSGTLSIEEKPGVWRAFVLSSTPELGPTISDAGTSSVPVKGSSAVAKYSFGQDYSRFAGKGADLPVVTAQLSVREGKFELLVGESRSAAQKQVQAAFLKLDKKPSDITRAWALAAPAQFLGLEDAVRYAEQRVAAHHPNLLVEFQQNVQRIQPYQLPR